MAKSNYLLAYSRFIARENEEGEAGETTPAETSPPQTFTQEQVNEIVVKRNKKVREQLETAETTVEKLLASQNLTAQDRANFEAQLVEVQSQLRTKEQQAAHEAIKLQNEHKVRLDQTTEQLNFYKGQFETSTRNNAILKAASDAGAYNPEQFVDTLGPRTKIVEETNGQGEKTGRLIPRVLVIEKGEDGTPTEVLKTAEEAIADMKEDVNRFGNMFRGNVAKGIGEGSNSSLAGDSRVDVSKMSTEEYIANRDAIAKQYKLRSRGV